MEAVLILGATSSVGRHVAAEFARRGYDLLLAARDAEEAQAVAADVSIRHRVPVSVVFFDVASIEPSLQSLEQLLKERSNAVAGTVLCIGYPGDQEKAQVDSTEAVRILNSNFTGCVLALNSIASHFEHQRKGFICAITSVAGERGRQSNYLYGAAKGGLSIYLQGLRNRLHRRQVRVIDCKLGFVDSGMTYGRRLPLLCSPERAAAAVVRAALTKDTTVYVPRLWQWIMTAVRGIPEPLFKRLRL